MPIRYAQHALRQMQRRGITRDDVAECLENHVSRYETRQKREYKGPVRGRMLKVGVAPDVDTDAEKLVTTAMWEGDDGS